MGECILDLKTGKRLLVHREYMIRRYLSIRNDLPSIHCSCGVYSTHPAAPMLCCEMYMYILWVKVRIRVRIRVKVRIRVSYSSSSSNALL